jgi:HD-like signal output (HDOD) protein
VLREIETLMASPGNGTAGIARLIGQDVGLAAAVFKVVNSPFYGLGKPVESVAQAILLLGVNQLVNIVKAASLRQAVGGHELAYEKFWERSQEIASLALIVANLQISACNVQPDQAYLAGLFHECGVPVLMERFPDYCKAFRLGEGNHWPDFHEEDRRFNTDHAVVGYLLAHHWKLPGFICEAVRHHHDRLHVGHAALTMVSILQMARHLHARLHDLPQPWWDEAREQVLEEIGVSQDGQMEFEEEALDLFRQQS